MEYTATKSKCVQHTSIKKKILLSTNIYSYTALKRREEKKFVSWHIKTFALSHMAALSRQHDVSSTAEFLKANIGTQSHKGFLTTKIAPCSKTMARFQVSFFNCSGT